MPNLDEHFDFDHWNAERLAMIHPNGVTWMIVGVEQREARQGRSNRKVEKWVLWFRETDKFVFMSTSIYWAIRGKLGPDTDTWKEATVTLKAIEGEGFAGEGYGIRVLQVRPPAPPKPMRVFGPIAAGKLIKALRDAGSSLDDLSNWIRRNEPDLWQHAAGRQLEDWFEPLLPVCKRYLDQLPKPSEAAAQAPDEPRRTILFPFDDILDDDIPF